MPVVKLLEVQELRKLVEALEERIAKLEAEHISGPHGLIHAPRTEEGDFLKLVNGDA